MTSKAIVIIRNRPSLNRAESMAKKFWPREFNSTSEIADIKLAEALCFMASDILLMSKNS